jgi:hypothetical protein
MYGDRFDVTTDMDAKEYVGMECVRDLTGCTNKLHQSSYCEKVLRDFGFWECAKSSKTSEIPGERLSIADSPEIVDSDLHCRYHTIVGTLG